MRRWVTSLAWLRNVLVAPNTTHSNRRNHTLALLAACGGDDDDADEAPESLLFVQNAVSGELTDSGDGYTLTLEGVNEDTVWFTDRPARRAGTEPTARTA